MVELASSKVAGISPVPDHFIELHELQRDSTKERRDSRLQTPVSNRIVLSDISCKECHLENKQPESTTANYKGSEKVRRPALVSFHRVMLQ